MTGTPEGSTESDFMEKPGIEPATPGLQGIALIHYTTGASLYSTNQISGCTATRCFDQTLRKYYFIVSKTYILRLHDYGDVGCFLIHR